MADPTVAWWVWTASKCVAGAATLALFGPAKVATVSAKIYKILKLGKTPKLKAAFSNWNYLNKDGRKPLSQIAKHLKRFGNDIVSTKGNFKKAWARMSDTRPGDQTKKLLVNSGTTIMDLVGVGSCYNLYKEIK